MKYIKKSKIVAFFILFTSILSFGQSKHIGLTLSNNTTGLPILAYPELFYSQFHPGIDAFYSLQLNNSENNKILLKANLGFYYHQFVQSLLRIYPTVNYERELNQKLSLGVGLGGGYGLSFEGKNAFVFKEDGTYENKGFFGARSQFLIAFEIGAGYSLKANNENSPILICQFKSFMQGNYVKSYVPLLPLNSINIGIRLPIKN